VQVGCERFHAPELLFQPAIWDDDKAPKNARGLSDMICEAIMACNPEMRHDMVSHIIVHGATAHIKGLAKRIEVRCREGACVHVLERVAVR
ncbi:actin-domain-containing protein, partial [Tribonema minus]